MADRAGSGSSAMIYQRVRFVSEPLSFETALKNTHEDGAGALKVLAGRPVNTNAGTGRGRIGV